jgi:hypothetical protein
MCGGAWCGLIGLAAVAVAMPFSRTLINQQEREVIAGFSRDLLGRLAGYRSRRVEAVEVTHAI